MTDLKFLEILAWEFRNALDIVVDERLYGRLALFRNFPRGCCRYTSDLLAEYLISKGIAPECIQMFEAESNTEQYTHCWLVVDKDIIVDITADQFNRESYFNKYKPIPKYYVGMREDEYLHNCFENSTLKCINDVGINYYCGDIPVKLKTVYDAVIKQIESGL